MQNRPYIIASIFDTETCNICMDGEWSAYPVAYMFGDIYGLDVSCYEAGDEDFHLYRHEDEALGHIRFLIADGREHGYIPIICAYNLMFDLQTLMESLSKDYEIKAIAQSSTNAYVVDLMDGGVTLLRFWDTFHLEMGGLAAMGRVAGLPKATGDWDYSLIRTPETPLTDDEVFYARRDVQVIPAYLRYILESNPWVTRDDLGVKVLTKTSLVRTMAERVIGPRQYLTEKRNLMRISGAYKAICEQEYPPDFPTYALRKACFRGGFTFTAARTANDVVHSVWSLDVTSMHHTFICGSFIPNHFRPMDARTLQALAEGVTDISLAQVLQCYANPFRCGFHARIRFRGLRLREGSVFDFMGIALIPKSKFNITSESLDSVPGPNVEAEDSIRAKGYRDTVRGGEFALGKLYRAAQCILHLNEFELWSLSRVYEWDSMEVLEGEGTHSMCRPPDYVVLQSMNLFGAKSQMKELLAGYEEGSPYDGCIPSLLETMEGAIRSGEVPKSFLESFYLSTVKGMFNGIYGVQAQDVLRPDYECNGGDLEVDRSTVANELNYVERSPKKKKVLYPYGMRIVGRSRMHLVIAMQLIYHSLGDRALITGGDTDSLKIAYDGPSADLLEALEPLHSASRAALKVTGERAKSHGGEWWNPMEGVGEFDVENSEPYPHHIEFWNKFRISVDGEGHSHVTCAGLPQPPGLYGITDYLDERLGKFHVKQALSVMGYNTLVKNNVCHVLQHERPSARECFTGNITDYLGDTHEVNTHKAISLYPGDRWLGETDKQGMAESVMFLINEYGKEVSTDIHVIDATERECND